MSLPSSMVRFRRRQSDPGVHMIDVSSPSEADIELYTRGSCHVFAAACVLEHGGSFLIATNSGESHFTCDDGSELDEVIHVFARLPNPDSGPEVIRDIHGDRILPLERLREEIRNELSERYGVWSEDIHLEWATASDLHELVMDESRVFETLFGTSDEYAMIPDHDDRPLHEMDFPFIDEARALEEVRARPGSRPVKAMTAVNPDPTISAAFEP